MSAGVQPVRKRALGVLFDRSHRPTELPVFMRTAETLAVDDVWFVEDIGWAGAMALTATALTLTDRLRIGMGICPVPLRNPVLHAMEIATLAEMHPHRVIAGLGHGSAHRVSRVAAPVRSKMRQLETAIHVVRDLVAGKQVTISDETVRLDAVSLEHVPPVAPPIYVAAVGPRTLALSGRLGDGTILAEGTTPEVLRRDLKHVHASGPSAAHEVVVYTYALISADPHHTAATIAPIIDKFAAMHDVEPEQALVASGDGDAVAEHVNALWDAGADTVVLRIIGADPLRQVAVISQALGR